MVNPKVVDWIKFYNSKGHNFQELEDFLLKNGYDKTEIEQAIKEVKKSNSKIPKILIYSLIIVLFIGLVAGGLYYFMTSNSQNQNNNDSENTSANNNQLGEDNLNRNSSMIDKYENNQTNNVSENNNSIEDSTSKDTSELEDNVDNESTKDNSTKSKNKTFPTNISGSISFNGSLNGSLNITINNSDINNSQVFDSNDENETQQNDSSSSDDVVDTNTTQNQDSTQEDITNDDSIDNTSELEDSVENETTQQDDIVSCGNLPQKLNSCEPFKCQLEHPFTGELVNRSVMGIENGKCRYLETTPGDGEMVCNYPEFERKEVSKYYEDLILENVSTYTINGSEVSDPLQESLDIGMCEMNID